MESMNHGQKKQAPPPPPLPEGMTVVQENSHRQAPPPPPLPEGMTVVQENSHRQTPPPPPLPEGMTAVEGDSHKQSPLRAARPVELPPPPIPEEMLRQAKENSARSTLQDVPQPVQKQTPPPPPLPTEMPVVQKQTDRSTPLPNVRGGRPTMSLTDAVNQKAEAERRAAEEAAKPCVNANGGKLYTDDCCYARSGMDGLYYFAKIGVFDSEKAELTFFDAATETVKADKIYTINNAAESMQCFANWNNQGNYYPAQIKNISEDTFLVNYDENPDVIEELAFDLVRFAPW